MDKQKINIVKKNPIIVNFGKQEFMMETYISPVNSSMIIHEYIGTLFSNVDATDGFLLAEWQLILSVVDKLTNIPIMEESDNIGLEDLITSGLWHEIKSKIINYEDLLNDLDIVVERLENKIALESSVGKTIDKLVSRGTELFDKISKIDFSEKGVQELVKTLQSETAKFEETVLAKESVVPEKSSRKRKVANNGTPS